MVVFRIPDVLAQGYLEPIIAWLHTARGAEAASRVDHAIYEHVAAWILLKKTCVLIDGTIYLPRDST